MSDTCLLRSAVRPGGPPLQAPRFCAKDDGVFYPGAARSATMSQGGGTQTRYRRVMLKISGEALMGDQGYGLHPPTVERVANEVKSVHDLGVEICMVIGGGNIFRGLAGSAQGMERTTADYMGMLATVMNALAVQSALEGLGVFTRVISAIRMDEVAEPYIRRRAVRHLEKKRVCIFAAGTGNPYFTTDTAATLRANEMNCEAIFKGTRVDGVYDKDPLKHDDAVRFDTIGYDDCLAKNLKVMDASAIALARDNSLPIIVFSLEEPGGFRGILAGQGTFTKVHDLPPRVGDDRA
jgi:uridylate kinase